MTLLSLGLDLPQAAMKLPGFLAAVLPSLRPKPTGGLQGPRSSQKGVVVHFTHARGHCKAFWPIVPPLQVAPSLACSVASLSRSPGRQLPDRRNLHYNDLADYLLARGDSIHMLCKTW